MKKFSYFWVLLIALTYLITITSCDTNTNKTDTQKVAVATQTVADSIKRSIDFRATFSNLSLNTKGVSSSGLQVGRKVVVHIKNAEGMTSEDIVKDINANSGLFLNVQGLPIITNEGKQYLHSKCYYLAIDKLEYLEESTLPGCEYHKIPTVYVPSEGGSPQTQYQKFEGEGKWPGDTFYAYATYE